MSRTFRRINSSYLRNKMDHIKKFPLAENEGYLKGRNFEQVLHRWFGDDNNTIYGPNKIWKKFSHKKYRALERLELNKLKFIDSEFYSFPETHKGNGLDLWDWA